MYLYHYHYRTVLSALAFPARPSICATRNALSTLQRNRGRIALGQRYSSHNANTDIPPHQHNEHDEGEPNAYDFSPIKSISKRRTTTQQEKVSEAFRKKTAQNGQVSSKEENDYEKTPNLSGKRSKFGKETRLNLVRPVNLSSQEGERKIGKEDGNANENIRGVWYDNQKEAFPWGDVEDQTITNHEREDLLYTHTERSFPKPMLDFYQICAVFFVGLFVVGYYNNWQREKQGIKGTGGAIKKTTQIHQHISGLEQKEAEDLKAIRKDRDNLLNESTELAKIRDSALKKLESEK